MRKPRFNCFICDGETPLEAYRDASDKQIARALVAFKLCTEHAQALDAIQTERWKAEIQRSVA